MEGGQRAVRGGLRYQSAPASLRRLVRCSAGALGDDEGYLKITGRKKDLILTSSGKNITPANIEAQLAKSRWISQEELTPTFKVKRNVVYERHSERFKQLYAD